MTDSISFLVVWSRWEGGRGRGKGREGEREGEGKRGVNLVVTSAITALTHMYRHTHRQLIIHVHCT